MPPRLLAIFTVFSKALKILPLVISKSLCAAAIDI